MQLQDGLAEVAFARLNDLLRLLVVEAAVGADDRVAEPLLVDFGLVVEVKDGTVAEFVLVGTERAEVVGECFGKHRDSAIDEIDGSASAVGLRVDAAAGLHVVGDVGDVDAHAVETALKHLEGEGVVEVLGIGGVDGEGGHVAEVAAAQDLLFRDFRGDRFGLQLDGFREGDREVALGEDAEHLHIVAAGLAEHVEDFADGIAVVARPVEDAHHHLVAGLGFAQVFAGDDDVAAQNRVVGHEEGDALLDVDGADELPFTALHDLDHLTFKAFAFAGGEEDHLHEVAVEGVAEVAVGHEDIVDGRFLGGVVLFALRDDEGHAAAFLLHAADDVVLAGGLGVLELAVQLVLAAAGLQHDLGVDELFKLFLHFLAAFLVENLHFGRYLLVIQFFAAVRQHFYDLFVHFCNGYWLWVIGY